MRNYDVGDVLLCCFRAIIQHENPSYFVGVVRHKQSWSTTDAQLAVWVPYRPHQMVAIQSAPPHHCEGRLNAGETGYFLYVSNTTEGAARYWLPVRRLGKWIHGRLWIDAHEKLHLLPRSD